MSVGQTYPPEWQTLTDAQTGRRVMQLTASAAEDYHFYFYNPCVTPDGRYLVFFSERTGLSNLFRLNLADGTITQLTDVPSVRAEYWPYTLAVRGAGACLAALGNAGQEVFYFVGRELWAVNIETPRPHLVLTLPADRRPSILNATANGQTLVFATWDEALFMERSQRAFAGEQFPDEKFFQATTSTILRLDARTGQAGEVLRREQFWINHVLINPFNPDQILFCHEWSGEPDPAWLRMWMLNVATGACAPIPGQGADEWYSHEFWSADGQRVGFHGGPLADENSGFCGWCAPDGSDYHKFTHTTPGRAYAHYNLHFDGQTMITDGEAQPGCISKVYDRDGRQDFEVLCRHDSYRYGDEQRCHPHPSFTPDGRQVVFTSNRTGVSNIYLTDWN